MGSHTCEVSSSRDLRRLHGRSLFSLVGQMEGLAILSGLTSSGVDLERVAACRAAADVPILLITTSGADPSREIEELAERIVGRGR